MSAEGEQWDSNQRDIFQELVHNCWIACIHILNFEDTIKLFLFFLLVFVFPEPVLRHIFSS
jgi:hypothetical protein